MDTVDGEMRGPVARETAETAISDGAEDGPQPFDLDRERTIIQRWSTSMLATPSPTLFTYTSGQNSIILEVFCTLREA